MDPEFELAHREQEMWRQEFFDLLMQRCDMTTKELATLKARLNEAENEERIAFAAMLAGDISPTQAETAISARYVADAQYRYARLVAECTTR